MRGRDLHAALRVSEMATVQSDKAAHKLVELQYGKTDIGYSLHSVPRSHSYSGIGVDDLLGMLGLEHGACAFFGAQCFATTVGKDFDLKAFSHAFDNAYGLLVQAERELDQCGYYMRPNLRTRVQTGSGDGHTSPKSQRMKESEDVSYNYAFTWIEGGYAKGWTTHIRPVQAPVPAELLAAFRFLGLTQFAQCPEFGFEPCWCRFAPFESRGESIFGGNAEVAHRTFEAHSSHFTGGVNNLIQTQQMLLPFGLSLIR